MINLFLGAVQVALLATGGPAVNQADRPAIVEVRMVCDQNCSCWPTRYRERRPLLADRPDLACPPPVAGRPALRYYNGHYRTGPATGAGFDSLGARELPFPF
jgi:hypothetical protein